MMVLLCLLWLLALVAWWRYYTRVGACLVGLSLVMLLAASTPMLPRHLLHNLQAGYSTRMRARWRTKPAIVLFGIGEERIDHPQTFEVGWNADSELFTALDLYGNCSAQLGKHQCRIVVSGGDPLHIGRAEADVYVQRYVKLGVPAADLIAENASRNTWENARFTSALLARSNFDQVVLVAPELHLRRSELYLRHFGVNPIAVRSDYIDALPFATPNSVNFMLTDGALHEYFGIAQYHAYEALGLNRK